MYLLLALFALWFVYRLIKTKGGTSSDSISKQKREKGSDNTYAWPKLNEYDFPVVGESNYQSSLAQIAKKFDSLLVRQCVLPT